MSESVLDLEGKSVGSKNMDTESSREVKVALHAMKQAVVGYLAHQRQGNHSTKTRAEVTGSGRKPWKQKGTGRARQGSRVAPHWRGGGIAFGPRPHKYSHDINGKVARLACESALRMKLQEGKIILVKEIKLDEPRSKYAQQFLKNLKIQGSALVVIRDADPLLRRAFRNLENVLLMRAQDLNAYEVLKFRNLIIPELLFHELELTVEAKE